MAGFFRVALFVGFLVLVLAFATRGLYTTAMRELATGALERLAPSASTTAYGAAFTELAQLLLARATLHIAGRSHRFTELELYYRGFDHLDPFTHGDERQQQLGRWYFHRTGGGYRGGTYKGLDIAFGNAAAFGGILIRGIASGDGALFDGPCVVVDHILAATRAPTIDALVGRFEPTIDPAPRSPLWIELGEPVPRAIYATARVGLSLKRHAGALGKSFIARPYRFLSEPARIRKGRPHLVIALHQQGRSSSEIAALTGTRNAVIDGYLRAFETGRGQSLDDFRGDLSPRELCALLGACDAGR